MKVFISWSGETSKQVAIALRDWLPYVLNAVEPYVSSEDIDKGERWSSRIAHELDTTNFGIVCLTADNQHAPWLNFEAGALAKSLARSRVMPFLLDMTPADVTGPLSEFQATRPEAADVEHLVRSLNSICDKPLADVRVSEIVAVWWPRLKEDLQRISLASPPQAAPPRDVRDMMSEALELTRDLRQIILERENGLATANALVNGRSRLSLAATKVAAQDLLNEHGYLDARPRLLGDTVVVASPRPLSADVVQGLRRIIEGDGLKLRFAIGEENDPWALR
jgi:hypothetical protein